MIQKKTYGCPFETLAITQDVPETDFVKYFRVKETEQTITFTYKLDTNDIVYGLGEMMGGLNKRGGRYIALNTDTANHSDENPSLYSSHNFLIIDGGIHFGIFFDTPARVIFEIDYELIARAVKDTEWIGRFTKVNDEPLTIIDGAHNEKAWSELNSSVNKYFTNRQIIYIIGVLKDKEYDKMVDILKDTMSYAIAITPDTPRGLDKEILADMLLVNGVPATTANSASEAIAIAYENAEPEDVVMICGSLSFLADYINYDYSKHVK